MVSVSPVLGSSGRFGAPTRIIACGVFRHALDYLKIFEKHPRLRPAFLPAQLHMNPLQLKTELLNEIAAAGLRNEPAVCLYGDCFPGIADCCRELGAEKVHGVHCYEMLLGSKSFKRLLDETAGSFFLERELIRNFEAYCAEPLELHDEEMRICYFRHYHRLIYVKQPLDPDLMPKVRELADLLRLSPAVRDADYSHLERRLMEAMGRLEKIASPACYASRLAKSDRRELG